jgi:hypothetical protein
MSADISVTSHELAQGQAFSIEEYTARTAHPSAEERQIQILSRLASDCVHSRVYPQSTGSMHMDGQSMLRSVQCSAQIDL